MFYDFTCEEHGKFTVKQHIEKEHKAFCPQCGKPARRIYSPAGFYFDNPKPLYHKDGSYEQI